MIASGVCRCIIEVFEIGECLHVKAGDVKGVGTPGVVAAKSLLCHLMILSPFEDGRDQSFGPPKEFLQLQAPSLRVEFYLSIVRHCLTAKLDLFLFSLCLNCLWLCLVLSITNSLHI